MKVRLLLSGLIFNLAVISTHSFAQSSQPQLDELVDSTRESMLLTLDTFIQSKAEVIDPESITIVSFPANYRDLKFVEDDRLVRRYYWGLQTKMETFAEVISLGTSKIVEVEAKINSLEQLSSGLDTKEARRTAKDYIRTQKDAISSWAGMAYVNLVASYNVIRNDSFNCSLLCKEALTELNNTFIDFIEQSLAVIEVPENSIMRKKQIEKEVNAYFDTFADNLIRGISIMPPFLGLPFISQGVYDGKFFGFKETMKELRRENKKSLKNFSRNYEASLIRKGF